MRQLRGRPTHTEHLLPQHLRVHPEKPKPGKASRHAAHGWGGVGHGDLPGTASRLCNSPHQVVFTGRVSLIVHVSTRFTPLVPDGTQTTVVPGIKQNSRTRSPCQHTALKAGLHAHMPAAGVGTCLKLH